MLSALKKSFALKKPQKGYTALSSGGQKRQRLAIFGNFVKNVGGNSLQDKVGVINGFLEKREGRDVKFELQKKLCGEFLRVVENIRKAHEEVPNNKKSQYLSLVAHLTAPKLRELGFEFSDLSFKHAREHARNSTPGLPIPHFVPPSKKEKSQELKNAVYDHLFQNSSPMANCTTKINDERVASRGVTHSWDFLYFDFCEKNPLKNETISKTTWDKWRKGFKIFKKARKQTDKCEICSNGRLVIAHLGRLEKQYPGITAEKFCETFDANEEIFEERQHSDFDEHVLIKVQGLKREKKFFEEHFAGKNLQREAFNKEVDDLKKSLEGDKALVILDFKQNVALNGGPVELSHQFFQRSQRTVLGFVVLQNNGNGSVKKTYVNFLSEILNHDALFVADCMKKLMTLEIFSKTKILSFWTDAGPHFRCGEFAHCLFETLFSQNKFSRVTWSLFVEKHGKNLCDAHFSSLSGWLKNAELKTHITTTEELVKAWEREIADENFVAHQKGKPARNVIFQTMTRNVLPKKKNTLKIPIIKSLYSFSRDKNDDFLKIKRYSVDKNYGEILLSEIRSVVSRGPSAKLKRAPKFPKLAPHFSEYQMGIQEKGQNFRVEQNDVELSNLLEKTFVFDTPEAQDIPPQPAFSAPLPPLHELMPENFVRPSRFDQRTSKPPRKLTNKRAISSPGSARPVKKRAKIVSSTPRSRKRQRENVSPPKNTLSSAINVSKKLRENVRKVRKQRPTPRIVPKRARMPETTHNVTVARKKQKKCTTLPEKFCDSQNMIFISPQMAVRTKKRKGGTERNTHGSKFQRKSKNSHRFQTRSNCDPHLMS